MPHNLSAMQLVYHIHEWCIISLGISVLAISSNISLGNIPSVGRSIFFGIYHISWKYHILSVVNFSSNVV